MTEVTKGNRQIIKPKHYGPLMGWRGEPKSSAKCEKAESNLTQYRQRVQARETLKKPKGIHSVSDAYKVLRKPVKKSIDWEVVAERYLSKAKDNPAWKAAEKKIIEMVNRHKMEKAITKCPHCGKSTFGPTSIPEVGVGVYGGPKIPDKKDYPKKTCTSCGAWSS